MKKHILTILWVGLNIIGISLVAWFIMLFVVALAQQHNEKVELKVSRDCIK
jgi:hypothetical protein